MDSNHTRCNKTIGSLYEFSARHQTSQMPQPSIRPVELPIGSDSYIEGIFLNLPFLRAQTHCRSMEWCIS